MSGRHMALTMRPIDIERSPAMAHLEDWIVLDDGIPIGRIYQRHAPANADVAWFWSIPLMSNRARVCARAGPRARSTLRRQRFGPRGSSGNPGPPKPGLTPGPADRLATTALPTAPTLPQTLLSRGSFRCRMSCNNHVKVEGLCDLYHRN